MNIETDKELQTWKKIICFFLRHQWYASLSWARYCERCNLRQYSDDHEF